HRLSQRQVAFFDGKSLFFVVQIRSALVQDAVLVEQDEVLRLCSQGDIQLHTGHGRSACAVDHKMYPVNLFLLELERIQQGRAADDGGSMLVVMHDGDLQRFFQLLLDIETFRGAYVLQVDPSEGRFERLDDLHELVGVFFIDLDIEDI